MPNFKSAPSNAALNVLLAAAIGVHRDDYDNSVTKILVSIGQGIFLDETYHVKAIELAKLIDAAFERERLIHESCLGGE